MTTISETSALDQQNLKVLEKNKQVIQNCVEEFWNKGDINTYEKFFSPDLVTHSPDGDRDFFTYKQLCEAYFKAFPDLKIFSVEIIAERDLAVKQWIAKCTHQGELMGIPASGNQVEITGNELFRLKDGKFTEIWINMDNLGLLQQLGAIPANP